MAWKCPECRGDVGVGPGFGLKEYLRPRTCKSCGKRLYTAEVVAETTDEFKRKWSDNHRIKNYNAMRRNKKKDEKQGIC